MLRCVSTVLELTYFTSQEDTLRFAVTCDVCCKPNDTAVHVFLLIMSNKETR